MDNLQIIVETLESILPWILAIVFLVGLISIYFSTHKKSGFRGVITYTIHLIALGLGWLLGKWAGIVLISLPILIFYYYTVFHLAMVVVPVSGPNNWKERWLRFRLFVWYQWGVQYPIYRKIEKQGKVEIAPLGKNSVFISYYRSDWEKYVKPLADSLAASGIKVWVDQYLLQGGDDWLDKINEALEKCNRMIICVTPSALQSKYVKMEYRYFFHHNKLLVPLICEKTQLPAELEGIQYLDYEDFAKLLRLLHQK